MLVVRATDGVVDQSLLVVDPGELGKVHHRVRVGVVLLRAREERHERVDPDDPRHHQTEVVQFAKWLSLEWKEGTTITVLVLFVTTLGLSVLSFLPNLISHVTDGH